MKFEKGINRVAKMMIEGKTELAKHHHERLMKHYGEMSEVEREVMECHRRDLFGVSGGSWDEESLYWEGRILSRQESDWD